MAQTILYYPTINIQDSAWLRNAVLYWDEVSSIVPYEDYPNFSPEVLFLQRSGVYKAVYPQKLFSSEFAEDFCNSIVKRIAAYSLAIAPQDDDMYIADVYWLVLSQLRAEKADEAQKTLKQHYRPDMYVGHHTAYEKAMRVAAGFAPMEDMLAELDAEEDDLQFAMTAYGLCVLLEAHGETEKADALRQKLLKRDGFWFCFSYLAAYSDYKYTVKPATVK